MQLQSCFVVKKKNVIAKYFLQTNTAHPEYLLTHKKDIYSQEFVSFIKRMSQFKVYAIHLLKGHFLQKSEHLLKADSFCADPNLRCLKPSKTRTMMRDKPLKVYCQYWTQISSFREVSFLLVYTVQICSEIVLHNSCKSPQKLKNKLYLSRHSYCEEKCKKTKMTSPVSSFNECNR